MSPASYLAAPPRTKGFRSAGVLVRVARGVNTLLLDRGWRRFYGLAQIALQLVPRSGATCAALRGRVDRERTSGRRIQGGSGAARSGNPVGRAESRPGPLIGAACE